ncbi:MAG: hypothetical protein JWP97_2212 [Labilithrix sp.]|nr:hypothetical protein [Labilithrix sp.]
MRRLLLALVLATSAVGCGGATAGGGRNVADADRFRTSLAKQDVPALAPLPFASANQELELAKRSHAQGDDVAADLHAERALAYYHQATAVARLARATKEDVAAAQELARASADAQTLTAQRKAVDHEADDLEKKLRVAREAQLPPSSGAADPERDRARSVAAQSLVTQARLLCSAARLVAPQAPGLADAEAAVAALDKPESAAKVAIDPAARARAACLASLTRARRTGAEGGDAASDALLAELSQAANPTGAAKREGLAPARDERGVMVTLRSAFKGEELTADAEGQLKDLGRVAAAHPGFAVQVVLHDAAPPSAAEARANERRGAAAAAALVSGGAAAARVKVEQAGARAPVVDPRDARHRERNARVEIVFVSA